MAFSLLLMVLGLKLRVTGLVSSEFRRKLRNEKFIVVMRTAEGRRARTFRFRGGLVTSRVGRDPRADAELVWRDPRTAVRVMLSKNELDGFSAIGRRQLRILGNFQCAFTFIELAG